MMAFMLFAAITLGMPQRHVPGLIRPESDIYYAIFVAVVLLGLVIGGIFFMRGGRS